MQINETKIFNENGDRKATNRKILLGNTTNIFELNELKYPWAFELYKTMAFINFWVPEEIAMNDDKKQYEKDLSPAEKRAYELVLSFLIVLDSYQVNMLKDIARHITAPELVLAITSQEFQESIHSYSYQFILESVVDPIKADDIYNYWREDEVLKERNLVIAELYDNFVFNQTLPNFLKAIFGNYVLESLYFYSGFAFFYTLGRQGKMRNTVQQIKYINRDELNHVTLFKNIIESIKLENPELFDEEFTKWVYEFFKFAVDKEINWGKYITKNQILGLNDHLIERYIKYLANIRLQFIGFKPLYEDITENPLKWIDTFRTINDTKTDFFQSRPQAYARRSELKW